MCKELVYPIGRNRGESVAHVKDVISKGGKLLKKGSLAVFDNDENYTESFLEYIEEKKGMPLRFRYLRNRSHYYNIWKVGSHNYYW